MEFMNVGGGEILIIILLALILFSPEDILKLMRTIGKYARTARQMWSNVTKSLQDDYIPDEVKEVVKETASSVKEARTTLSSVRQHLDTITASVEENVEDASQLADSELAEAVSVVNSAPSIKKPENSMLKADPQNINRSSDTQAASQLQNSSRAETIDNPIVPPLPGKAYVENGANEQTAFERLESLTTLPSDNSLEVDSELSQTKFTDDSITLTKEIITKKQDIEGLTQANGMYTKLAKLTEESLKDGEDDS